MTGKRILMVDDDEALRASLAEQLQLHEEFETTTAGTAAEALEVIKQDYFDVVLLDVGLPDMDGRAIYSPCHWATGKKRTSASSPCSSPALIKFASFECIDCGFASRNNPEIALNIVTRWNDFKLLSHTMP